MATVVLVCDIHVHAVLILAKGLAQFVLLHNMGYCNPYNSTLGTVLMPERYGSNRCIGVMEH